MERSVGCSGRGCLPEAAPGVVVDIPPKVYELVRLIAHMVGCLSAE